MRAILLGLPCAGKDTQGKRLSMIFGIPHISIGKEARRLVHEGGPLGRRIQRDWEAKEFLSDELAYELMLILTHGLDSWILDGCPRNVDQARTIGQLDLVLHLDIPDEISTRRMMARQRPDDIRETPAVRIAEVNRRMLPMLDYFRESGANLVRVDAVPCEEQVLRDILGQVGAALRA